MDNLDNKRLENLNNLRSILTGQITQHDSNTEPLEQHGSFHHDFSIQNITGIDLTNSFLLKEYENTIPIISNIKQIDNNTLQLTRIHLSKNFYNKDPFGKEIVYIKRNNPNTLISKYEDPIKKLGIMISNNGIYTSMIKFKNFRNANEVLFNQNIFYYKSILDTYYYYKALKKTATKKNFDMNNLYYYEYIKNLL